MWGDTPRDETNHSCLHFKHFPNHVKPYISSSSCSTVCSSSCAAPLLRPLHGFVPMLSSSRLLKKWSRYEPFSIISPAAPCPLLYLYSNTSVDSLRHSKPFVTTEKWLRRPQQRWRAVLLNMTTLVGIYATRACPLWLVSNACAHQLTNSLPLGIT